MDVTWDDAAAIRYDYFNKTDADFASTHEEESVGVSAGPATVPLTGKENTTGQRVPVSRLKQAEPHRIRRRHHALRQSDRRERYRSRTAGNGTQEPEQPGSSQ